MRGLLAEEKEVEHAAAAVLQDLALQPRLALIGDPVLVGSAALRVMVRRDIDLTTACADLSGSTVEEIIGRAAALGCADPRRHQIMERRPQLSRRLVRRRAVPQST
ncbi:MAG TPA: hypothetical protein VIT65_11745 [Microlunatus sp.]